VKYFQLAAQDGTQKIEAIDPEKQNPIVFPGVEITSKVGYQVIVLLDANADESLQHILLHAVGITPVVDSEETGPEPRALDFATTNDLDDLLERRHELEGRYIILPHVGIDGYKTLAKKQLREVYASMSCVGGYIECDYNQLGRKCIFLFDGKRRRWGNKPVGIFQTSDFRGEAVNYGGNRSTWVKMAEFTAEAIRQACLAKESRISQEEPKTPTRYIQRIQVSNSTFMGPFVLELNPELNAIIGGRGTGKSTILEYLKWAMQDQPMFVEGEESVYGVDLIKDTLKKVGGQVTVHWIVDGVPHVVNWNSTTKEIKLRVAEKEEQTVTPESIKNILPIRSYSQKQLSTVSIRTTEIQRFVEQPIQEELNRIGEEIQNKRIEISERYTKVLRVQGLKRELAGCDTKLASLKERIASIEKTLPELSAETKKVLEEYKQRLQEEQIIEVIGEDIDTINNSLQTAENIIAKLPREVKIEEDFPQAKILKDMYQVWKKAVLVVQNGIKDTRSNFTNSLEELNNKIIEWGEGDKEFKARYKRAEEEARSHKEKITQLSNLRNDEAVTIKKQRDLQQDIEESGNAEGEFTNSWNAWIVLHRERGDILEKECATLLKKSGGFVEAKLTRGADVNAALELVDRALQGARIQTGNWDDLSAILLGGGSVVENWLEFMLDLRKFAEAAKEDIPDNFTPPTFQKWNLTENQRRKIVINLKPERWIEIALTSLKDVPEFFYRKGQDKIPFKKASAGEQATALLTILLNEDGGPLIIDQPEDDLNKELTYEIVKQLWEAKKRRQIIITSHDANLVVNGDAELVVHCDYESEHDRSKGTIKNEGAIDVNEVREVITKVMEGGKRAFELRREKYGF
jgi:type III restriction enzyme